MCWPYHLLPFNVSPCNFKPTGQDFGPCVIYGLLLVFWSDDIVALGFHCIACGIIKNVMKAETDHKRMNPTDDAMHRLGKLEGKTSPATCCFFLYKVSVPCENKTEAVTEGRVYDELHLSSSFISESSDWCFYWRTFRQLAPQDVFGPTLYHFSLEDLKSLHNPTYLYRRAGNMCVCLCVYDNMVLYGLSLYETQWCVCVMIIYLLPDVHCNPTLLSLSCLTEFQIACGVQTATGGRRPTVFP